MPNTSASLENARQPIPKPGQRLDIDFILDSSHPGA